MNYATTLTYNILYLVSFFIFVYVERGCPFIYEMRLRMEHNITMVIVAVLLVAACTTTYTHQQHHCISQPANTIDIFLKRSSGRNYDRTRHVTHEQLQLLIKSAQAAPSSSNEQPWNFIICDRFTAPEAFNKVLQTLVPQNKNWAQDAAVLIVVVASLHSRKGTLNKWALYDTGAAAFSMALEATLLGLMAHQMGGFSAQQISQEFAISDTYLPIAIIAIGYAHEAHDSRQKRRKPYEENFFWNTWNK